MQDDPWCLGQAWAQLRMLSVTGGPDVHRAAVRLCEVVRCCGWHLNLGAEVALSGLQLMDWRHDWGGGITKEGPAQCICCATRAVCVVSNQVAGARNH